MKSILVNSNFSLDYACIIEKTSYVHVHAKNIDLQKGKVGIMKQVHDMEMLQKKVKIKI